MKKQKVKNVWLCKMILKILIKDIEIMETKSLIRQPVLRIQA